jgi:hypothetical protein
VSNGAQGPDGMARCPETDKYANQDDQDVRRVAADGSLAACGSSGACWSRAMQLYVQAAQQMPTVYEQGTPN